MKKYLLIAFMASVVCSANAQKLQKPQRDKITGDVTLSVKEQVLSNPFTLPGHYLAGNMVRGKNYWALYFHLKDGLNIYYYVLKGDKAIIKFTDGKLLEITSAFDAQSSLISYATPDVTESFLAFELTDDDVAALLSGKLSVIRINTSMGAFDYDIKDSKSEIIKKQLELIAKK
ncbi:hypothetical protein [Mucilaginibacter sp. OK098]|uniref:hypothetical protein n=1 Tax=Mucilaginibacter sp. OK098 TaxID=1855297 RepID=UPI00091D844D|nr:hypothetical protein [Mucilaginibacter sp. OK098]SHN00184.1 hypothetical protein SAMN05216524_104506 [Mucilaginibacter sp. OK098]